MLRHVRIVIGEHGFIREEPLFPFLGEWAELRSLKNVRREKHSRPKFHQRWMLRVQPIVTQPRISNPSGDVITLINMEAIQSRGDGGAKNSAED